MEKWDILKFKDKELKLKMDFIIQLWKYKENKLKTF